MPRPSPRTFAGGRTYRVLIFFCFPDILQWPDALERSGLLEFSLGGLFLFCCFHKIHPPLGIAPLVKHILTVDAVLTFQARSKCIPSLPVSNISARLLSAEPFRRLRLSRSTARLSCWCGAYCRNPSQHAPPHPPVRRRGGVHRNQRARTDKTERPAQGLLSEPFPRSLSYGLRGRASANVAWDVRAQT